MLSTVCRELRNWFELDKAFGVFEIVDGQLSLPSYAKTEKGKSLEILSGQYIRIVGSVFNDGVYQFPVADLQDEKFEGAVWLLAIPKDFLDLVKDIEAWQEKNGGIDSAAMSPFSSESFGGYSYSKGSTSDSGSGKGANTWQGAFKARLNMWRKIL